MVALTAFDFRMQQRISKHRDRDSASSPAALEEQDAYIETMATSEAENIWFQDSERSGADLLQKKIE